MGNQISNNKIRQIILLGMIFGFLFLIGFNLSDFLPSFLGAITLYVIFRDYYLKLTEERKWKPWLAIGFLMLLSLLVIIVPIKQSKFEGYEEKENARGNYAVCPLEDDIIKVFGS